MSDTPRTDAECGDYDRSGCWKSYINGECVQSDFARQLERELNAANESFRKLNIHTLNLVDRIRRLEEAGDGLMKSINCGCPYGPSVFYCQTCTNSWDAWRKAKEAKP